jgi:hypothetical protein
MQPLGDALDTGRQGSELQLHQVRVQAGLEEAIRRQLLGGWEFSDGHGDFVAGVAPGAVQAIFHGFVWEGLMLGDTKVKVFEEVGDASEETDALDAFGSGLIKEGADEQAAGSLPLGVRTDSDGADLGEVLAVDVECSTADELLGYGFDDGKGADVGTDLHITPRKQGAIVGEAVDQAMDGAGVLQLRFPCAQGCCFELAFDEGGREGGGRRFLHKGQCHRTLHFSSFRLLNRSGSGLRLMFEGEAKANSRSCGLRWTAPRG